MVDTVEIQVFVSCPGDVAREKEIVKEVCKDVEEGFRKTSNVRLQPRDWKDIVGKLERYQPIINREIHSYDIYVGLWWMRFGSKTGNKNPETGKEFESGTVEEFEIARAQRRQAGTPEIYLFKKKPRATEGLEEVEQLLKVEQFFDALSKEKPKWVNYFDKESELRSQLYRLLTQKVNKVNDVLYEKSVEHKKEALKKIPLEKLKAFHQNVSQLPDEYIARSVTLASEVKKETYYLRQNDERNELEEVLFKEKRVVLLGDAGAGKSTELKHLYHSLQSEEKPLIPVFQRLNTYTAQSMETFLPEFWKEIPAEELLIIWDGFDEINPKYMTDAIHSIEHFAQVHPQVSLLISSRTNFYELPEKDGPGTLLDFQPYYLNSFGFGDVEHFYQKKYGADQSEAFVNALKESSFADIAVKPFFLIILAERFATEGNLSVNRVHLYEEFLEKRIRFDEMHFRAVEIRKRKKAILKDLKKVALTMEIMAKNMISVEEVLELLNGEYERFDFLKRCTAFKKKEGEEEIWQFEHNNIQEYLAAKKLSESDFDKVIDLITFEPQHEKLKPNWLNTLSFLFSVLPEENDFFQKLLKWLIENEQAALVKFEADKVPEPIRNEIFQSIFNYYKAQDIWLSWNKYNVEDLARFGQSEINLNFLINEIEGENTRTVKLNAIYLLGKFVVGDYSPIRKIEDLLIDQIKQHKKDPRYIEFTINALRDADVVRPEIVKRVMGLVGQSDSQYIRSAMYAYLSESEDVNYYVDYLLEGYELKDKERKDDEGEIRLADEGWILDECTKKVSTYEGLKKIIKALSEYNLFEDSYDKEAIYSALIEHAIKVYATNPSIYKVVLVWYLAAAKNYILRDKTADIIITFFEKTNTLEQAFSEIWNNPEIEKFDRSKALGLLMTESLMEFVINKYLKKELSEVDIKALYSDMEWFVNERSNAFKKKIYQKTDIKIEKRKIIDYEKRREERLRADFNLFFDSDKLKEETIKVFEEQKESVIDEDKLYSIRRNNRRYETEDFFSGAALSLLRGLAKDKQVSKAEVLKWFEKKENVEWFQVTSIYNKLMYHKELEVSKTQKKWLVEWCHDHILEADYQEQLTYEAMYIWYFTWRLDIEQPKGVLLNMLSYDWEYINETVGIEHLIKKLDKDEIVERMIQNLKKGISYFTALKNHANYLLQQKVTESYPLIEKEILNTDKEEYNRRRLLELYFEHRQDIIVLKEMVPKADKDIKWELLRLLKENEETSFVEKVLLEELKKKPEEEELTKTIEWLIPLQNIEALRLYVERVKKGLHQHGFRERGECLEGLEVSEALPYLWELLEYSYRTEQGRDIFDQFSYYIYGTLENIALSSEFNFQQVIQSTKQFISQNAAQLEEAKNLHHKIERWENLFYTNKAKSYTIEDAIEKLKMLEK